METPNWMRPEDLEKLRDEREKSRLASEASNSPEAKAEGKRREQEAQEAINKKFEYAIRANDSAKLMLRDVNDLMGARGMKRLELGTIRDKDRSQTVRMTLTLHEKGSLRIQRVNTVNTEPEYTATWDVRPIASYVRYPIGRQPEKPLFLLSCGDSSQSRHNKDIFTYGGGIDDPVSFHCEDCGPGIPRVAPFSTGKYPAEVHDCLLSNALTFACFRAGLIE